jgi:SnoaL-like domain
MISAVERLEAQDRISRLMFTYAECIDQADFAGVGALFEHGVWHNNREIGQHLSGDEVTRWLDDNVKVHGEALATRHCTTNLIIDVADDGETATARSYIFLFQVLEGFPLQPIFLGRYHDTFHRVDGAWFFKARVIMGDGVGDLSEHVLAGVLPGEEA